MNYEDLALSDAELIDWQEREYPTCHDCDGRRGIDCTCDEEEV